MTFTGCNKYWQSEWMSIPGGGPNCPRGLESLLNLDQLWIRQQDELLEVFTGYETNNIYLVKNNLGQNLYFALEDTGVCKRCFCGQYRPFDMRICDKNMNEVLHLYRPLKCDNCFCPCCLQTMKVSTSPGNVIGSIEQEWTIFKPAFRINNEFGDTVLGIKGPFCTYSICGSDVEFKVVSLTGKQVGLTVKNWSGLPREFVTDTDYFGITFPKDLDVRMKATLLGSVFLIDYMFYER